MLITFRLYDVGQSSNQIPQHVGQFDAMRICGLEVYSRSTRLAAFEPALERHTSRVSEPKPQSNDRDRVRATVLHRGSS